MKFTIAALTLSLCATAAPARSSHNIAELPFHYPQTTFKTLEFDERVSNLDADPVQVGKEFLLKELGLTEDDFEVIQSHQDNQGVHHIYGVHKINGVQVDNHNAAVHVKDGQVVNYSSSFVNASNAFSIAKRSAPLPLSDAVKIAVEKYGIDQDDFPAKMVYLEAPNNKIVYAHQFQLRDDSKNQWMQVSVDANSGDIVQVIDYVQEASFHVIPNPKNIAPDGFETLVDPAYAPSSPKGWNSDGTTTFTDTHGNNVDSAISGKREEGGAELNFSTAWDATKEPTSPENKRAATINNFYVSNLVHDISYQYGFTEAAGNFQTKNFQKGGAEGDSVKINNQASGSNNANFATPPDGQRPTMNMFLWTFNTPKRDGSLENSVPIHEYTHGISNRLTGGSRQANCLRAGESGGMGEGWSDAMAMFMQRKETDTRATNYVLGAYVYNNPKGIRSYPYSTDLKTNPLLYSVLNTRNEVHAQGELWTSLLNEMYWNLVEKYGFSSNLYDATQKKGNIMALQLMIGGMMIQPCNPKFADARDAIIAADKNYYGGENKCLIWKSFAKRGLGIDAVPKGFKDGFKVPEDC